jgi:3-methyladenine DNA glycosylase/8-oxoguanine DNA glycosylase
MRALADADAFLPTDLGVRRGLEALGHDGRPAAAWYMVPRQDQKSRPLIARDSDFPRISR